MKTNTITLSKTAVIYSRVSTADKQDYNRQLSDLRTFAKRNDYKILGEFSEKISGAKKERPEFKKMIQFVETNQVQTILVTELSRFGRIGVHTRLAIEELSEKGIDVYFHDKGMHTVNKNGKVDTITMMMIGILADLAKNELDQLEHRIKSGLKYSASNNGAIGGKYQPYGFQSVDKKLVRDVEESKVVEDIFKLYQDGFGTSQIAQYLNKKGIKTRFNKVVGNSIIKTRGGDKRRGSDFSWSNGTIYTILTNPLYKGQRHHKDEVFEVEPLIKPIVFDAIQEQLSNKNNRPNRTFKNVNYLKGIIKCGVCGQGYFMHQRQNGKDSAFKCLSGKLKYDGKVHQCSSPSININKLYNSLIVQGNIHLVKAHYKKLIENEPNEIDVEQDEYDKLTKAVKQFNSELEILTSGFRRGIIKETIYLKQSREIERELSKSEAKLKIVTTAISKRKKVIDLKSYQGMDLLPILRDVIKYVKIYPVKQNGKLNNIYTTKNDIVTKVEFEYWNWNAKTFFYLSRYSNIMTSAEFKTTDLKNNLFTNFATEHSMKNISKSEAQKLSNLEIIQVNHFRPAK